MDSTKAALWTGSIATLVLAFCAVLTYKHQYGDEKPVTLPNEHETNRDCKILPKRILTPIEIEKGSCFSNDSNAYKSIIRLVTRNAIVFSNYKGKEITCSIGDTCSFGWPDAPIFHIVTNNHPEENVYIVGSN